MSTTLIPGNYGPTTSFTMTHYSPRIISLHDSDGNMYIAERLIHMSQVNNAFLHGLEPWGKTLTGLHALECFFLKQRGDQLDDPEMQKRVDTMENFQFTVANLTYKEPERPRDSPPFDLVDIKFHMEWTLDGKPGGCEMELPFVCISKSQFENS